MSKVAERILAIALVLALMATGGAVNAQTIPATAAELKKQKDDAEAQRDTYKAQLEAELAKRAYEAALDPSKQAEATQAAAYAYA